MQSPVKCIENHRFLLVFHDFKGVWSDLDGRFGWSWVTTTLLLGRQMGSSGWHLDGIWRCLEDMGSYLEDPKSWEYAQVRVTGWVLGVGKLTI